MALLDIVGTPLQRVCDVRLAAVILMIQLVRTGAPLTAAEKQVIFALLDDRLRIEDRQVMFERTWPLTEQSRAIRPVADALRPLFYRAVDAPRAPRIDRDAYQGRQRLWRGQRPAARGYHVAEAPADGRHARSG